MEQIYFPQKILRNIKISEIHVHGGRRDQPRDPRQAVRETGVHRSSPTVDANAKFDGQLATRSPLIKLFQSIDAIFLCPFERLHDYSFRIDTPDWQVLQVVAKYKRKFILDCQSRLVSRRDERGLTLSNSKTRRRWEVLNQNKFSGLILTIKTMVVRSSG